MREGYAACVHFANGWEWINEYIFDTAEEAFDYVKDFPRETIAIDKIKEISKGYFTTMQVIYCGDKIAYWVDDEKMDKGGWIARDRN